MSDPNCSLFVAPTNRVASVIIAGILCAAGVLCAGCLEEEFPGESIGTYDIKESLESDTCSVAGGATAALSELRFSVELRREVDPDNPDDESSVGYWRRIGQPIIAGTIDSEGTYAIAFTVNETYPANGSTNTAGSNAATDGSVPDTFTEDPITEQDLDRISGVSNGTTQGTTCVVTRQELLAVTPDGETLGGTHQIDYTPIQGPCNLIVGTTFQTLPCQIQYELEADGFEPPEPSE